jgi:signal transduction histidine kinase
VSLGIVDDGEGFDSTRRMTSTMGDHYGLLGMQDRVERVGGEWTLASQAGRGTTIAARFSLPAEGHDCVA